MAEDTKQRKVDTGRSLLGNYMKKKQHGSQKKSDDAESEDGTGGSVMDVAPLHKKTTQFLSLKATIQQLQDSVTEKNEIIQALEIQNKTLRQGRGDEDVSPNKEQEEKVFRELQSMVDARDTYIDQLSKSLQNRSDELSAALKKEKELTIEIKNLQSQMKTKVKQNDDKMAESVMEAVGYRAKVEVLTSQIQENSEIVKALRLSLQSSMKKTEMLEKEIYEKERELKRCKIEASEDIKKLMRQVEELNYENSKKSEELFQSRKQIETLQNDMEERIGNRIREMQAEFEMKTEERIRDVETMYDNMMLEHLRKSDTKLRSIDKCSELEREIESCRRSYEQEISRYKEDLNTLLEKNKATEEQLLYELDKYKHEADKYKQQVENFKNNLSEEVQKIKNQCYLELDKYESELNDSRSNDMAMIKQYQSDIENLSIKLQTYSITEAKKEVELESYGTELKIRQNRINDLVKDLEKYNEEFNLQREQISFLKGEVNYHKELNNGIQVKLAELEDNEHKLIEEIEKGNGIIKDYEQKVCELNDKIRFDTDNFNRKLEESDQILKGQVVNLINDLECSKSLHKEDFDRLTNVINEQTIEISRLQDQLAYVRSLNQAPTVKEEESLCNSETQTHNDSKMTNTQFLVSIWNGLKNIKAQIKSLLNPDDMELFSQGEQNHQIEESTEGISIDKLALEVETTLVDVLDMTQHLQMNGRDSFHPSQYNEKMYSSQSSTTKNKDCETGLQDPNEMLTSEKYDFEGSKKGNYDSDVKCPNLEEENASLKRNLKSLVTGFYEMETCLGTVSQECYLFNKKCQMLESKLSEMEQSKLSEFLLKKENDELKLRFKRITDSEEALQQEISTLQENNIKLETIINQHVLDVLTIIENTESNPELTNWLTDLKEKSDKMIQLKSLVASLQGSDRKQKLQISDLQSKYDFLVAKHEFLAVKLESKTKELQAIWQDKDKLCSENKLLHRKLTLQGKLSVLSISANLLHETNSENNNKVISESESDQNLQFTRELELISDSSDITNSMENGFLSRPKITLNNQLNNQQDYLAKKTIQEQMFTSYHLPTIVEEDSQEDLSYHQTKENQVKGHKRVAPVLNRSFLTQHRSGLALRQLLSVLFDEYTSGFKKELFFWNKCETLDFNLKKDLDVSVKTECLNKENQIEKLEIVNGNKNSEFNANSDQNSDSRMAIPEDCIQALVYLKRRLETVHNAVLKSINIQKEQLENGCLLAQLKEEVKCLRAEKVELEKEHKSAIDLLMKDHENELGLVKTLLLKFQETNPAKNVPEDVDVIRAELEQKYKRQMEELRLYYEKRCADMEKQYSEEIYSQSQKSCKESENSSLSDFGNMAELFGSLEDEFPQQSSEDRLHADCEKRISYQNDLIEKLEDKYSNELEAVKYECQLRLSVSTCKICRQNNLIDDEVLRKSQSGVSLEQYFTDKIKETSSDCSSSIPNTELELKVYQIKEEVRKDYEQEIEKIRDEIVTKELKKKDEEIKMIKTQLNAAHKAEIKKLWNRIDELANKEAANSALRVKNEVILSQDLEEKVKQLEQLKNEKKELTKKHKLLIEQKQQELEQLKIDLKKLHKKEVESLKQAFDIELTTRVGTVLEEKVEVEEKLKQQIAALQDDIKRIKSERDNNQTTQTQDLSHLTDSIRKDILRALELQIKAMVASGDEREEWPPELAALERQFAAKYQQQLAQLVEEHALEMADMRADYDAKLSELVKDYSIKEAEEMTLAKISTGDQDLDKIIRERDNLRSLALMLRQVVQQLASYLTSCEDELNRSIVGELVKLASPRSDQKNQQYASEGETSDSEVDVVAKKVHFAPDVSNIVNLMEEDCLFECLEHSVDVSVHLRSELETCLERLRAEAATVLGLTQVKERALPSTVEDRRSLSLTRKLIEEKKAKEEALRQLEDMRQMLQQNEQELVEVHKELIEAKTMKSKTAVEMEYNEKQCEESEQKPGLLQEKARSLLTELGECPPQLLGVIEDLCTTGDALIEEAWRARDQLQFEVEAADKQLRSTRAFLEEQAAERELERDEFTKDIAKLTDQLREKDRDWTSHKHFTTEVEALEQQVQETTELLKETEEKKVKVEEELKAAVDKIWVLRDIISELEVQVCSRGQREASLEQRLVQLELELESQGQTHTNMLEQLAELREGADTEDNRLEQPRSPSQPALRQIKSQLRGMARSLEKPIKELEALNIHVSCASLSSPSEDISVREQLELLRCSTPEGRGSNPPSPVHVEEISVLNDRLQRYARAAETVIKKLRDQEMEVVRLRAQSEELMTEKEVMRGQTEKQLVQLATLKNKVEELRSRNERDTAATMAPLHQRMLQMEGRVSELTNELNAAHKQVNKLRQKLERSESVVASQDAELSSLSQHQHEMVDKLKHDLGTMQAEKQQLQSMVEKYREADNVSFPLLVEVMLAEKNADIDQLQQRVNELEAQHEHKSVKNQHSKARSYRVSFADDIFQSHLGEGDRARDALEGSDLKPVFSTPVSSFESGEKNLVPRVIGGDISKIPEPPVFSLNSSPNRAVQLEGALSQLKTELEQKTQRLLECEAQLAELPRLEDELRRAKEELTETVAAVDEDKCFYADKLNTLSEVQATLAERENELAQVRADLEQKEEDIEKTKGDVKHLQKIMEGLQEKLKEARAFAEACGNSQEPKISSDKYEKECNTYKEKIELLEDQLIRMNKDLVGEKAAVKTQQETLEKLENDKQNILSELAVTKSNCSSLQENLNKALTNLSESNDKIVSLTKDLEELLEENKALSANCQRLKKDVDRLSKKQKSDLKNILKKDSEEAQRMKDEIESLKSSNSELQSCCEKLQQELYDAGNNIVLLNELNSKDDKIQQLESELVQLDMSNKTLKDEKTKTECSLNMEISDLKTLIDDLNKSIESRAVVSNQPQEGIQERERKDGLARKYDVLKREYDRQRRARREMEKKYSILKEELVKEKQFSARLQSGEVVKREPRLEVTKTYLIDVRPDGMKESSSLDDLTDEVKKELDTSAQLDQTLLTGLQQTTERERGERSEMLPPRTDFLRSRLAEAETCLHVERVVVSELRSRLAEERARYVDQRTRADALARELAEAHIVNDQFEAKFKDIAHQFEQQMVELKELGQNVKPSAHTSSLETEKLNLERLLGQYQKKVDELTDERVFNRNQLSYMREEMAKLRAERAVLVEREGHAQGNRSSLERLNEALNVERMKNAELQRTLDQNMAEVTSARAQIDNLEKKLKREMEERRSLKEKMKVMELIEKSSHGRRRSAEEKLKGQVAELEKEKKRLEQESLALQLKLKQSNLQLTAQSAESPLALRLREANMAVERLVGEKEDLNSTITVLKEEKRYLQDKLKEREDLIEELKSRIQSQNIKVTDGGLDNLNALFAAEREAWLKEKENLRTALAHKNKNCCSTDTYTSCNNTNHILQKFLRAESHRVALVWQKRYLLVVLKSYQEEERHAIDVLSQIHAPPPQHSPSPERKFRVAVCAVRAVFRLQFILDHRRRSHQNTCRFLRQALNNPILIPRSAENVPEIRMLWRNTEATNSSQSVQPATLAQYLTHFNSLQDRIKNTLSADS